MKRLAIKLVALIFICTSCLAQAEFKETYTTSIGPKLYFEVEGAVRITENYGVAAFSVSTFSAPIPKVGGHIIDNRFSVACQLKTNTVISVHQHSLYRASLMEDKSIKVNYELTSIPPTPIKLADLLNDKENYLTTYVQKICTDYKFPEYRKKKSPY